MSNKFNYTSIMSNPSSPKRWLIGKVGTIGYSFLYEGRQMTREGLGPDADHLEDFRRKSLPNLHTVFEWLDGDGYAMYPLSQGEYAGTITEPPEEVEEMLWENDLIRNPLAALKTDPFGETEVGSWMYRDPRDADRQVHVMLFRHESDNGDVTDLYAHKEYSAGHPNPEIAVKHYNGNDYDTEAGGEWVRENLPVEDLRSFS